MVDGAAVGEELLAGLEADVVTTSLGVRQAHPLPRPERAAVHAGPGLRGHVVGARIGMGGSLGRRHRVEIVGGHAAEDNFC